MARVVAISSRCEIAAGGDSIESNRMLYGRYVPQCTQNKFKQGWHFQELFIQEK